MNLIEKLYYFFPLNNFKSFWNKNRLKFKNKKFRGFTDDFVNSKSYYLTSNLWHSLNITNFKQIINEGGLKNYSNTLGLITLPFSLCMILKLVN